MIYLKFFYRLITNKMLIHKNKFDKLILYLLKKKLTALASRPLSGHFVFHFIFNFVRSKFLCNLFLNKFNILY